MGKMHDLSDAQLFRAYAAHGTEAASAKIVARHTGLIYSATLRQVNSPDLARKAASISANLRPELSPIG